MSTLIARLDTAVRRNGDGPAVYPDGLSAPALAAFERSLGLELPAALRALYAWHDGTGDTPFIGNRRVMSAADVLDTRARMATFVEDGTFEHPHHWHTAWVPFLTNGAGSFVCFDPLGSFDGSPGQVLELWKGFTDRVVLAADTETFLTLCTEALERSDAPVEETSQDWLDALVARSGSYPRRVDYHGPKRWPAIAAGRTRAAV